MDHPLSPVLFNVYTIGITCGQFNNNGRILSYVDGVLIYRRVTNREEIAIELQDEFDRIGSWRVDSGALVNPTNAALTCFSLNNNTVHTSVSMPWVSKTRSNTIKYLEVIFDRSFTEHVDHTIVKARKSLAALRVKTTNHCEHRSLFLL